MKPIQKVIITVISIIILAVILYFITNMITTYTGHVIQNPNLDNFSKCLTEKGVKMYGAYWCGHCQNQKKSFGDSWQYINYVECDPKGDNPNTELCLSRGIQGYPTWEINNQLYTGEKTFEELAKLSGCVLS